MSLPRFDTQGSLLTSIHCVAPDLFAEDDRYLLFSRKIWPVLAGTRSKLASHQGQVLSLNIGKTNWRSGSRN